MKFIQDRKASLCIYIDENLEKTSQTEETEMEGEINSLKRELEGTKLALKLQSQRCRQLVSAFTKKLQDKEYELRCSKSLRDQQLSYLLRALLVLESRLRREQKQIRKNLLEKDLIIQKQRQEIVELQKCREKCDASTWTGNNDCEVRLDEIWITQNGEDRLDSLCRTGVVFVAKTEEDKKGNSFKDNPVLESVNQILLNDEDELMKPNKQETNVFLLDKDKTNVYTIKSDKEWYETDTSLTIQDEGSEAWCISVVEGEEDEERKLANKSHNLEEKVCLEMSKKHLTVAKPIDKVEDGSYQELVCSNTYVPVKSLQKPPALPPKPAILLKPHQLLRNYQSQANLTLSTNHKHPVPKKSSSTSALSSKQVFDHNSNVKSKIHVQEIKRNQMNGHIPGNVKEQDGFVNEEPRRTIKLCSSVSSLITGTNGDSILTELMTSDKTKHVSQLVKQFEVLNKSDDDDLRKNFEEFKLEESLVEEENDGRLDGDGAETRNIENHYATVGPPQNTTQPASQPAQQQEPDTKTYEAFLETTGLSQKSILTPSRMLSNHRSCLKPKDIKHRSRIKAAANINGPTVKYWTEPYL